MIRAARLVAIALFLSGCAATPRKAVGPPAVTYDRHEVGLDDASDHTVLTGFLLDDATANLAVVSVDADEHRRLRIYALRETGWTPAVDAPLRPAAWSMTVFVALARTLPPF